MRGTHRNILLRRSCYTSCGDATALSIDYSPQASLYLKSSCQLYVRHNMPRTCTDLQSFITGQQVDDCQEVFERSTQVRWTLQPTRPLSRTYTLFFYQHYYVNNPPRYNSTSSRYSRSTRCGKMGSSSVCIYTHPRLEPISPNPVFQLHPVHRTNPSPASLRVPLAPNFAAAGSDGSIPEGQGIVMAHLNECHELLEMVSLSRTSLLLPCVGCAAPRLFCVEYCGVLGIMWSGPLTDAPARTRTSTLCHPPNPVLFPFSIS